MNELSTPSPSEGLRDEEFDPILCGLVEDAVRMLMDSWRTGQENPIWEEHLDLFAFV
jgi:hypothetical protein